MTCSENPGLSFFVVSKRCRHAAQGAKTKKYQPGQLGQGEFEGEVEGAKPSRETSGCVCGGGEAPHQLGQLD